MVCLREREREARTPERGRHFSSNSTERDFFSDSGGLLNCRLFFFLFLGFELGGVSFLRNASHLLSLSLSFSGNTMQCNANNKSSKISLTLVFSQWFSVLKIRENLASPDTYMSSFRFLRFRNFIYLCSFSAKRCLFPCAS